MQAEVPFAAAMDVPDLPYGSYAELLGLGGRRVDDPQQLDEALDEAFAARRPVVLDAVVDPAVPMIPPHLTLDQVVSTAKSQLRGDPAARHIVAEGVRETVGAAARAVGRLRHDRDQP